MGGGRVVYRRFGGDGGYMRWAEEIQRFYIYSKKGGKVFSIPDDISIGLCILCSTMRLFASAIERLCEVYILY